MPTVPRGVHLYLAAIAIGFSFSGVANAQQPDDALQDRLDRLEGEVQRAEDVSAIKRLQRTYGYFLDKGMWADLAEYFTDDAVANYPAGVFVGKDSIRQHLFMNVGGVETGRNGLGNGRLYNHMNIQPVVHLDADGRTASGRWRAMAMFGRYGSESAVWAEGVYEMTYRKVDGVWKMATLDYHSGFGAPYTTGWVPPEAETRQRGPRNLPHPPDRERNMECNGFPDACMAPFHYDNPGTSDAAHVWPEAARPATSRMQPAERAQSLLHRATLLKDEQDIENLQRIFGYYYDRGYADHAAALFADNGTIELELRGVYVGPERIESFLRTLGPYGGRDGLLNDHVQLQIVVTVDEDGRTAKSRSRALSMTGEYGSHGEWREGIYENTYVKEDGVWKISSLRYFPTFISDYDKGWTLDARAPATVDASFPPDRAPTEDYQIYPAAHIPPYHYLNPVTGRAPTYPAGEGRPARAAIRRATAAVDRPDDAGVERPATVFDEPEAAAAEAARLVARVKDYHEIENLEGAYGYYLDKNLWNDLADLFAREGSMELAQRGIYRGQDRVRAFLLTVFGRGTEGPVAGRLGNHLQWQPVIHVSADGHSGRIRSRMMQQLNFGPSASMGASLYENQVVREDGRWKFSVVHTFNTWTAGYEGGWISNPGRFVPGPSEELPPDGPPTVEFRMFPNVYEIPFHYRHPVTGQVTGGMLAPAGGGMNRESARPGEPGGMPEEIAAELADIGARIEPGRTGEIYAPLHPADTEAGFAVTRDQAYGPHPRNVLDIFAPLDSAGSGAASPVLVFIHGGGFARGVKKQDGLPFYDNVMRWAASRGMIGVNINYRLAPEHQWPSGIEDLTAVVDWLRENIADHGGDPGRIFLWGHSAGAAHAGDYIARRTLDRDPTGLAGAVLTSGFYDLGDEVSVWQAYYGDDVTSYPERSSVRGLAASELPLLVNDAELDPESFREQARLLVKARHAAGRPVEYLRLLGHSHISETYAVGTADTTLSDAVYRFVMTR